MNGATFNHQKNRTLRANSCHSKGFFLKPHRSQTPIHVVHGRSLLVSLILLAGMLPLAAHVGTPPISLQQKSLVVATGRELILPTTEVAAELAKDAAKGMPMPLQFAVPQKVEVTPAKHGGWTQLPEGRLWRLRVVSTNATDLNFGFSTFWLPEGATLHILADTGDYYQGPYTAGDNSPHGELWTPVVPGATAVIEMFVPAQASEQPRLVLAQVGTGYRDFFRTLKNTATPKAEGACNNDVVCPAGIPWTNEIRSVGRYSISGSGLCTGTLVANTAGDFRPYFLTANHCGVNSGNAASVVVYWNYQSTNCSSAHLGGSLAQNQSGAIFRAAKYDVDVALLELSQIPSLSFNVYYAGWDRSGVAPNGAVGIHHPDGDVKAISFATNTLASISSCIGTGGSGTHWYAQWGSGVTEPGSSGSGLWGSTSHQLVGTLSGGNSICGGADLSDCYGKFSVSWASGTSSASRLRDWLDPQNTGVTDLVGATAIPVSLVAGTVAALVAEGCIATNGVVDPGEAITVSFSFKNVGTLATTNLVVTLLASNGVTYPSAAQTYGALPANGAAVARSFTFVANGVCGATISPTLQLQDGTRNLGTVGFSMVLGALGPAPVGTNYSSGNVNVEIPDTNTVEVPLIITDAGVVTDLNVRVRLNHTYDGDLTLSLVHPDTTVITLVSGSGGSGNNFGSGAADCSGNFTVFDDDASTVISSGTAPFAGSYRPIQPLTALNGKSLTGTWKLRIADEAGDDTGTNFCFQLNNAPPRLFVCCTGAPPVSLVGIGHNPSQQFQFNVSGGTGYPYAVLASTNVGTPMSNWTVLLTNTTPFIFIDSNSPGIPQRFYRTQPK